MKELLLLTLLLLPTAALANTFTQNVTGFVHTNNFGGGAFAFISVDGITATGDVHPDSIDILNPTEY